MDKDRELIQRLPLFMQEFREMQAIMKTAQSEMTNVRNEGMKVLDMGFVDFVTEEEVLHRYEKIMKIVPGITDTVVQRRKRIKSVMYNAESYTLKEILNYLDNSLGSGSYTFNVSDYTVTLSMSLAIKDRRGDTEKYLREAIPANMQINIQYMFNTHESLRGYKHLWLMQRTHFGIREEELEYAVHEQI